MDDEEEGLAVAAAGPGHAGRGPDLDQVDGQMDAGVDDAHVGPLLPPPPLANQPAAKRAAAPRFADMRARAAFARAKLATKRATTQVLASRASEAKATSELRLAAALLPGVGRLVGQQRGAKRVLKADAKPTHFCAMAFAGFAPGNQKLAVGVKRKRLVAAMARLVQVRHSRGLQLLMRNARLHKASRPHCLHGFVVAAWTHEWDETRSLFRGLATTTKFNVRAGFAAAPVQTLVQRGRLRLSISPGDGRPPTRFSEEWIAPARTVAGTGAGEIFPAIVSGLPAELNLATPHIVRKSASSFDALVFQPIGDKASSNLAILKFWGQVWKAELQTDNAGARFLYFPETCQVHSHHRGKLSLKSLQMHTTRHFSLCNLYKLPSVQSKLVAVVEKGIEQRLVRVLEKPPASQPSRPLKDFFEILYDSRFDRADADTMETHFTQDVRSLLQMANGDPQGDRIKHYCRGSTSGRLCCASKADSVEKLTATLLNLLLGSDGVPCESRWTNLLPNMKRTLTRHVLFGLGTAVFDSLNVEQLAETRADSDDAARSGFLVELNGVRAARAKAYFADAGNLHQLGVLTILLGVCDRLLFAMLGGPDRKQSACTTASLLDRRDSLIAEVLSELLRLLDSWMVGGASRRPWSVLDLLKAPVENAEFALWSRSQVLRMAASLFRRYELKYSSWPYKLFRLCGSMWSAEAQQAVAKEAAGARECCLDTFARGMRHSCPSEEALLSDNSKLILENAFASLRLSTDWCERQNAEVQAVRRTRGRALDFTNFCRENQLKQARVAHRKGRGNDPLKPASLRASALPCEASLVPFLVQDSPAINDRAAAPLGASHSSDNRLADGPGAGTARPMSAGTEPTGAGLGAPTALVAATSVADAQLVWLQAGQEDDGNSVSGPPKKRVGLNPYLAFRNQFLKTAKEAAGRALTAGELQHLNDQAKERWEGMGDKSAHAALYQLWRETPVETAAPLEQPYLPTWGGGNRGSPVTALELYRYNQEFGWPSDPEVFDRTAYHTDPDKVTDFGASSGFDLWGCGRSALAVCKHSLAHPLDFDMVHRGLTNFLDKVPKSLAESASIIVMVEGRLRGDGLRLSREVAAIVGTCWSPKVLDIAMCMFERPELACAGALHTPFEICFSRRALLGASM